MKRDTKNYSQRLIYLIIFLVFYACYFKKSQASKQMKTLTRIDMLHASAKIFAGLLPQFAPQSSRSPSKKLFGYLSFGREFFISVIWMFLTSQMISICFGDMDLAEFNIDFLDKNFIFDFFADFVLLVVINYLGLLNQFTLIIQNIAGYMRIKESMALYTSRKREYLVDGKDLSLRYLDHFLRNSISGYTYLISNFTLNMLYTGKILASKTLACMGIFGCATIYQILTINGITSSSVKVYGVESFGVKKINLVKFFTCLCFLLGINFSVAIENKLEPIFRRIEGIFTWILEKMIGDSSVIKAVGNKVDGVVEEVKAK